MPDFLTLVEENSQLNPVSYQYFNHLFNHRTVVFNDGIDKDILEAVILPLKEFENDDSNDPVKMIISTPGGAISEGLVLCNIIDNYSVFDYCYIVIIYFGYNKNNCYLN